MNSSVSIRSFDIRFKKAVLTFLLDLLIAHPDLDAIWLFGSRAMGRERPGSDIDLCVDASHLSHRDRLWLMAAIDDLLLPWTVDLALCHELPPDLLSHVQRVGRRLWTRLK